MILTTVTYASWINPSNSKHQIVDPVYNKLIGFGIYINMQYTVLTTTCIMTVYFYWLNS